MRTAPALWLLCLVLTSCAAAPACPACPQAPAPTPTTELVVVASAHDHGLTVTKLVAAIEARGMKVVQQIDHAAAATAAGLELPATTVLVFGNPKAGTPLMQAAPTIALDLPLRVLVRQVGPTVEVVYRAPAAVAGAYGIGDHPVVAKMTEALAAIAADGTRP